MNSWCIPKGETLGLYVHTKLMALRCFKVGIQFSTKTVFIYSKAGKDAGRIWKVKLPLPQAG